MTKYSKKLYIIAGANGSGKSTLAYKLLPVERLEFLNADEIAKEINPDAIDTVKIQAGKEYFKRLNTFFNKEQSFIIETTLAGGNTSKIISKAKSLNYDIALIYVFIDSPDICIERVKVRVKKGGHNIPEEDIIRRYHRSLNNFYYKYKERIKDWAVYYNGQDEFIEVVKSEDDKIEIIDEILYTEFTERLNNEEAK